MLIVLSIALVGVVLENATNQNENSPKLGFAPENPEFVKYHNNKIYTQAAPSQDRHKAGFVPAPVDLNYLSNVSTAEVSAPAYNDMQNVQAVSTVSSTRSELSAPAYYDLRTLQKVTTVKNQGSAGACWAFATYTSLESYLMSGENRDFSENNMKNLLSSAYPEGFDRNPNDGGNEFISEGGKTPSL